MLGGCATGDWDNYQYGPGDWVNENTGLTVDTMYNYTHLVEPDITYHYIGSGLSVYCGNQYVAGCARLEGDTCEIWVGTFASPSVIAHEERHCRGWAHYRPDYDKFSLMSAKEKQREINRARVWYPSRRFEGTNGSLYMAGSTGR